MNGDSGPDLVPFERISPWRRQLLENSFHRLCILVSAVSVLLLITLLGAILYQGLSRLSWSFLSGLSSSDPDKAGILGALVGSTLVCLTCALTTLPLGVATAILLEEYKPRVKWIAVLHGGLELLIANLAGVPSVVYGLLGLSAFVHMFGMFGTIQEPRIEIGASYYHQYESALDGRMILIPAESSRAERTPLVAGMTAYTSELQFFDLRVIERGEAEPTDRNLARRTIRRGAPASPNRRATPRVRSRQQRPVADVERLAVHHPPATVEWEVEAVGVAFDHRPVAHELRTLSPKMLGWP